MNELTSSAKNEKIKEIKRLLIELQKKISFTSKLMKAAEPSLESMNLSIQSKQSFHQASNL